MKHSRIAWLRTALVMVVCFSSVSIAVADNIGTDYTGIFPVLSQGSTVWQPWLQQVGGSLTGSTDTIQYLVTFSATITNFAVTPPCGSGCPQYFSGNLDSGSVSFSGTDSSGQYPYNFNANVTPGGSITGGITCDDYGCSWFEGVLVNFNSKPSGRWQSIGNIILDGGNGGGGNGDSGSLSLITMPTPEPNSLAFFGTGVAGLAGALRRKRIVR